MSSKNSFTRSMEECFSGELTLNRVLRHLKQQFQNQPSFSRSVASRMLANADAQRLIVERLQEIGLTRLEALRRRNKAVSARKSE